MTKALELVKLAKEGNASRFGDAFVASVQERVSAIVQEKRTSMFSEDVGGKLDGVHVKKIEGAKDGEDGFAVKHGDKQITTHPTEKGATKLADKYRKDGKL